MIRSAASAIFTDWELGLVLAKRISCLRLGHCPCRFERDRRGSRRCLGRRGSAGSNAIRSASQRIAACSATRASVKRSSFDSPTSPRVPDAERPGASTALSLFWSRFASAKCFANGAGCTFGVFFSPQDLRYANQVADGELNVRCFCLLRLSRQAMVSGKRSRWRPTRYRSEAVTPSRPFSRNQRAMARLYLEPTGRLVAAAFKAALRPSASRGPRQSNPQRFSAHRS